MHSIKITRPDETSFDLKFHLNMLEILTKNMKKHNSKSTQRKTKIKLDKEFKPLSNFYDNNYSILIYDNTQQT